MVKPKQEVFEESGDSSQEDWKAKSKKEGFEEPVDSSQSCRQCGKCSDFGSFFGSILKTCITNGNLYPCELCDFGSFSGALKKHIKNDHNHYAQVLNLSVYFVMPIP